MLIKLGADVNARDLTQCTPLQNAAHGTYSALATMPLNGSQGGAPPLQLKAIPCDSKSPPALPCCTQVSHTKLSHSAPGLKLSWHLHHLLHSSPTLKLSRSATASPALDSCTQLLHSALALSSCTQLSHSAPALSSRTGLLHSAPKVGSCTQLLHSALAVSSNHIDMRETCSTASRRGIPSACHLQLSRLASKP